MTSELIKENGTIPVFAGTHVPQLRLPSSVRLEVMRKNGAHTPAATFAETEIISNEEIAPEHYLMRVRSQYLSNGEPRSVRRHSPRNGNRRPPNPPAPNGRLSL